MDKFCKHNVEEIKYIIHDYAEYDVIFIHLEIKQTN